VHAQSAVDARAAQADEDAELGRGPLWRGGAAVAAAIIPVGFLDLEELWHTVVSIWLIASGRWLEDRDLTTFDRVSGSTSHMALLAMLQQAGAVLEQESGGRFCAKNLWL
jgi:hypothetical protein